MSWYISPLTDGNSICKNKLFQFGVNIQSIKESEWHSLSTAGILIANSTLTFLSLFWSDKETLSHYSISGNEEFVP